MKIIIPYALLMQSEVDANMKRLACIFKVLLVPYFISLYVVLSDEVYLRQETLAKAIICIVSLILALFYANSCNYVLL